jgi:vanillate O-demethylase monooxygenase subunit
MCRWLLGQRVVLFRTENGAIAALEDRCAHRWGPLSQGKLIGDEIACPYHGFRYNTRGACTLVPSQSHTPVPAVLKVRSYPVREHGTFVWIWMGDPGRADSALLPDIPWFTDPAFFQVRGYIGEVGCNYMAIQENLLDLTHVAYLHTDTLQVEGRQGPPDVQVTDRSVTFAITTPDLPASPMPAVLMGIETGKRVNRVESGTFASPACHFSGVDSEDPAPACGKRSRYTLRAMYCTTPISPDRCHYWWAVAVDFGHQLPNLAELFKSGLEAVFKQDKDILEAIQMTIDQDIRGDTAPEFLVASDRAPVEARRILKKLLEAESPL